MAIRPTYVNLNPIEAAQIQRRASQVSPLDSLIQGGQQGLQFSQLPQQLEDQALARQLQNAINGQKLYDLQNPDKALARRLQEELAYKSAFSPDSGVYQAPAGLAGQTIANPGAITPEQQAALPSPELINMRKIAEEMGGAPSPAVNIPTARAGANETPISLNGIQTGFNLNPNIPAKAAEDKFSRQLELLNARPVQNMLVPGANGYGVVPRSGDATFTPLLDANNNPVMPKTSGKLSSLTPNARISALKYMGQYGIPLEDDSALTPEEKGVYNAGLNQKKANESKLESKNLKDISDQTEVLSKDIQNNKAYQAFQTVSAASEALKKTLDYAKSNPTDQTGIKSAAVDAFNQIVNPHSVVRQTAFSQTTAGQSILNRFENFFEGLSSGQTITSDQIQAMVDLAGEYEKASKQAALDEISTIKKRGDKRSINAEEYIPPKLRNENPVTTSAPVKVSSKAERDALKPGTVYISPSGAISTR